MPVFSEVELTTLANVSQSASSLHVATPKLRKFVSCSEKLTKLRGSHVHGHSVHSGQSVCLSVGWLSAHASPSFTISKRCRGGWGKAAGCSRLHHALQNYERPPFWSRPAPRTQAHPKEQNGAENAHLHEKNAINTKYYYNNNNKYYCK